MDEGEKNLVVRSSIRQTDVFAYTYHIQPISCEFIIGNDCQKIVDIVYANARLLMAVKFLVKHYQINVP